MNCSLCDLSFEEEKNSEEHIIPQSIGGKKTVKGFICEKCNNSKGNTWDAKLAKELQALCIFFKIKRERSDVPPIKLTTDKGDDYLISVDGQISLTKPTYIEEQVPEENKTLIRIQVRNEKEAIQQIMRAKKHYPQIDVDSMKKNVKFTSTYIQDHFKINIGIFEENSYKSLIKTALAMVVQAGISSDNCKLAKDYLQGDSKISCFNYFYEIDPITNRPEHSPLHCIWVKGNPDQGVIYAYVEIFGIHRGLIYLSDNYSGETFESYYSIDPRSSTQLTLDISLEILKEDIEKYISKNEIPTEKITAILEKIISEQLRLDDKKEQERVTKNAVEKAFLNCGAAEGESLSEEHMKSVINTILTELQPWLINQIKRSRSKP
jgi:hypothetical protein